MVFVVTNQDLVQCGVCRLVRLRHLRFPLDCCRSMSLFVIHALPLLCSGVWRFWQKLHAPQQSHHWQVADKQSALNLLQGFAL
jgi:hypothetical protein